MWELYRTLRLTQANEFTADNLTFLLSHTPSPMLYAAFRLMYPKLAPKDDPLFLALLLRGLRENNFFGFVQMIRKLS